MNKSPNELEINNVSNIQKDRVSFVSPISSILDFEKVENIDKNNINLVNNNMVSNNSKSNIELANFENREELRIITE